MSSLFAASVGSAGASSRPALGVRPLVILAVAHVALGLAVHVLPLIAFAHAALVVAALMFASWSARTERVLMLLGYTAGSQVLWRMSGAPIPWIGAEYVCIAAAGLTLLRRRDPDRLLLYPLLYSVPLLLSLLVVLSDADITTGRAFEAARFYLAGPFALALVAMVASGTHVSRTTWDAILAAVALPTLAIASIVLASTLGATNIAFTTESNITTSGGFGPNQVSTALGLGAMASMMIAFVGDTSRAARLLVTSMGIALGAAAAITFSRGGLYGAVGALLAATPFLLANRRARARLTIGASLLAVVSVGFIAPRLDRFTSGQLAARFSETQTTNRMLLVQDDLQLFLAHPLLGTGPGQSGEHRVLLDYGMGHTEFSRMLAEHGSAGLVSLVALLVLAAVAMRRSADQTDAALRACLLVWAFLTMSHAAMRLVAPAVVMGLACAAATGATAKSRDRNR